MARQSDAPRAQAQPLGHDLVNEAQRDRQTEFRAKHFGQVAVGGVVEIFLIAGELLFLEQHIVQMRQQRLRLRAANAQRT